MERVAIAQKIEEALAGRQGGDRGNQHTGGKVQPVASCQDSGKTRDIAAAAVGWSGEQYRQTQQRAFLSTLGMAGLAKN